MIGRMVLANPSDKLAMESKCERQPTQTALSHLRRDDPVESLLLPLQPVSGHVCASL